MFSYLQFLASGSSPGDLSNLLSAGTTLVTWLITTMTSVVTFIVSNDIMLIFLIMAIVSFAVGLVFRIWQRSRV